LKKVLPKYRTQLDKYLEKDITDIVQYLDLETLLPVMKEMILSFFTEGNGNIGAKIKLKDTMEYCVIEGDEYLGTKEWFKLYFPSHIECCTTLAVYKLLYSIYQKM